MSLYSWGKKYVGWFFAWLLGLRVTGRENLVADGGALVCANHTGWLDPIAMALSFERPLRIMAKKELSKIPLLGRILRSCGVFFVDRGHGDVGAVKKSISLVTAGELVCVYPQGTRYRGVDPMETPVKSGVGLIAYRSKARIQPVYIKLKGYKYRLFSRTEVIIGAPISYDELGFSRGGIAEFDAASKLIFGKICALRGEGSK